MMWRTLMGEKILSWFERIVTGEIRRWFFAAVIVAIILGVIVFPLSLIHI